MSKQEKSRKPLIIGIIAAVAILAVLLTLLLTQCTGSGDATQSTPAQTVGYLGEAENYDLYWNLDRALYDGKSEAGMSSRKPESDGYFHVRFFKDGEILELKVADRKTVNAIEVNDLMGLEFDSNGIVVGVISLDDMPLQQVGWKFYVQSIGGKMLKLNSAKSFDGMELLCEMLDDTGIYDMTGAEGEVGKRITPIATDRVIAIANLAGELTHVYIYERSEYMQSFEAECQHCKETVTWKMWNKPDTLPKETGHYQLTDNIVLKTQQSIAEDAKICLDLNGKVVDGASNKRVYSLHNVGANLALMDTSEEKTGVLRGHSESSPQGGIVWVRYGAFYMYGGTLDGSDMTSVLNGTVVQVPKGCFFYMYDGTIIGGTSMYTYNAEKNSYGNGLGGALSISGKFVMHDGLITGGKAVAAVTKWNKDGTPSTYQRGIGGNIYVAGGGEFEMKGGTIKNGVAGHSGGNVYLDGTSTMVMDGGTIAGGAVTGKGRNGGNVFVTSKATFTFNGGSINWGTSYNCAANLYSNGTVIMNGGYIGCGVIRDWATNKVKASNNTNVYQVNGKVTMYGGVIDGGFSIIDTSATDKNYTSLILGGMPVISGREELEYEDLVLINGGSGVKVTVLNLVKGAKIGVNATTGIFTVPTNKANVDKFYSTIEGAEVLYVDDCLALGRWGCVCGSEKHFGACDGTQLFWAPINSGTIPNTTGNYYLAKNITISAQCAVAENADVKIDLNGFTLTGPKNKRALTTFTEGSKLTVTDSSEGKTGVVKSRGMGDTQGNAVWVRYGSFDFYGGTLDGSEYTLHSNWGAGKDKIFGTKDDTNSARDGGTVAMIAGTTFNMYGGTIIGNKTIAYTMEKTVTEGEGEDAVKKTVTKDLVSSNGGALALTSKCVFNMYDGVIRDGVSDSKGGNIYCNGSATLNLYGGTISGGRAGMFNEDGTLVTYEDANGKAKVKSAGWGGNIDINDSAVVNLLGVTVTGGTSGGNGGNIRLGNAKATLNMTAGTVSDGQSVNDQGGNMFLSGTANLTGGTVENGKSKNGGNITVNSPKDVTLKGVTVIGGYASGNGGNIRIATTNATGSLIIAEGTVISGGIAEKNGGNIAVETNNANKNDPVGKLTITGGTITSGRAGTYDENGNLAQKTVNSVKKSESASTKTLTINGEKVTVDVIVTTTETRTSAVISQGWGGNISLGNGAVMEMTGGKIVDGKSMNGGNLYATGTCVVSLKGGEIAGGVAGEMDAAGVPVKRAYTVTTEERLKAPEEYGAAEEGKEEAQAQQIENQKLAAGHYTAPAAKTTTKNENVCTGWGGNLYLYSGELNLLGTSISGGKSGGNGGSIYVRGKDAVLNMSAGQVVGGQSTTDQGGNIWAGSEATLNITGGSIKNGTAAKNGGNIHTNANVNVLLDNVTISGGSAYGKANYKNANVNISASENVTIANVNIAGYVCVAGNVNFVGKPVIKGGETNLTMNGGQLDVSKLEVGKDTAMVGVSDSILGIFTGKADKGEESYFFSDDERKGIVYVDGHLAVGLGKNYCLCGHQADYKGEHLPGCDGKILFWQAWHGTAALPTESGNYYLLNDINISSQTTIIDETDAETGEVIVDRSGTTICLDLNGFTVQNKEGKNTRLYRLNSDNISLTVTDTVGTGVMKNNSTYTQGGLIWMNAKGISLTLITGVLDVSDYTGTTTGVGAAVAQNGSDTIFTMYGGTIYAPGAKKADGTYGTGMSMSGGAVAVNGTGKMYLKGGTIHGGLAQFRSVEPKAADKDGNIPYNIGGGAGGALSVAGYLEMSGGIITGGRASWGEGVSKVDKDGKETIANGGGSGGNIYLTGTMVMTGGIVSDGKAGVVTHENGEETVAYFITSGTSKTTKGWGGNIDVAEKGSLTVSGTAVITGGVSGGNGGNIRLGNTNASFTMTGGTVSGGQSSRDQGGNIFTSGTTTITGGTVTGGKASNGGNIGINNSKPVTIGGNAKITNGTVTGNGGNIRIFSTQKNTGELKIEGNAVISGGSANAYGGNISIETYAKDDVARTAKVIIAGGTISDGISGKYDEKGNLAQSEGQYTKKSYETKTKTLTIEGNKVTVDVVVTSTEVRPTAVISQGWGGNIFVTTGGIVEMTGGEIVDGKSMNGGNIYASSNAVVTLKGGTVSGGVVGDRDEEGELTKREYTVTTEERLKKADEYGTAAEGKEEEQAKQIENQKLAEAHYTAPEAKTVTKTELVSAGWGGNVYLYSGELNLAGATVSGGTSGGNGGSIYVRSTGAVLNMSAGSVSGGCTTDDQGGNIWGGTGATLNITGGSITGGSAAKNGGNIHTNANVNILLDNVTISGGSAYGKANYKNANVNISNSENAVIASANIAGYVSVGSGAKLAGKPVITGGETNLSLNGNDIDITALDVGTDTYKVGITDSTAGIFTGVAQQGEENYFYSDDTTKVVGFMNGKLTLGEGNLGLGRYTCLCARPGGTCVGTEGGCDGQIHFWTAWTSTSSLPTGHGYWYLTNNVKTSAQFAMEKDATIHIDLNGKTVTDTKNRTISTSDAASIGSGNVELWITDSSIEGTGAMVLDYTSTDAYPGQGAILLIEAGTELNLIAGTLDASGGSISNDEGGAAVCVARESVFNMYGGTVTGGEAGEGGAVSLVRGGTFNMYGGTINGGKAVKGGSLYVLEGTANIYGGTITGGEAEEGGNIYIETDGQVNLDGGFVTEGKAICYDKTGGNGGNGGNIYVLGQLTVDGATVENGKAGTLDTDGTTVLFTSAGWGGNIYLGRVQDSEDKTVYYTGAMEMLSGTIGKGESKGNGGSIYIQVDAEMTMSGGTVKEGKSHADQGGNIFCSGSLSISGGEVKDGEAKNGGNIGINTPETVTISGGTISGGEAAGNGGNIRINSTNTTCALTISGTAEITGGTAKNGGNIAVERYDDPKKTIEETANVTVQGGNITLGSSNAKDGNGGNIYLGSDVNLTVTAGTISNGSVAVNSGRGGNIYIGSGSDVSITGGTVSDGQAGAEVVDPATQEVSYLKGWGGNIMIKGGSLTLGGTAEIVNGWANNNGGSINVESGSMTMSGGKVYGGTTLDRGGNIFVAVNQTLTVTGGSIYNGTAVRGGNIAGNAGMNVSLSNVSVYGGTATNTEKYAKRFNMEVIGGTGSQLTLGDGVNIAGGVETDGAVALSMSGKVIIDGGDSCASNLSLKGNTITLGEMKADSSIGITDSEEGPFTNATDAAYLPYFFADDDAQGIAHLENVDKCLWLGHYDCLCAGAGENGACVGAAGGCTESKVLWMPWAATTMPKVSGNWYLTASQVKYKQIRLTTANTDIRIDLNGKSVVNDEVQRMYRLEAAGVKVTLTDSEGTGKITNSSAYDQGGIFWVSGANTNLTILSGELDGTGFSTRGNSDAGGTLIQLSGGNATLDMYGGIVKGGTGTRGLAVDVSATSAVFNMHGGELVGGTVTFQKSQQSGKEAVYSGGNGGAVHVNGSFNMTGGRISGGSAVYASLNEGANAGGGKGDNVYVASTGTLDMSGGTIVGGVDASNAASVSVSGTAVIDRGDATNTTYSLQLGSKELTVGELKSGAAISITADEGAFTNTGRVEADLSYFSADSDAQGISLYNGQLHLGKYSCICGSTSATAADHKHYMDGDTRIGCDGTKVAWTPWTSTSSLPITSGYFYLTDPVAISGQASLVADSDVVLDLNGYKVTPAQDDGKDMDGRIISLHNSGAKFTLTDTYTVPDSTSAEYNANRTGGEIVGSKTRTAKVNTDGTIGDTGCVVWVRWHTPFTEGTTFVMLGGKLTAADATSGKAGAVLYVSKNGKFYMLDGSISGGTTTSNGGNVYVDNSAIMHMAGGSITGGTANNGGNVCVNNSGSLIMTGGEITGGKSGSKTPTSCTTTAVHADVQMFGTMTMSGGKIGAGIQVINNNRVSGASLTLSGTVEIGKITLNKFENLDDMEIADIEIPTITIVDALATSVTEGETTRKLTPIQIATYSGVDYYFANGGSNYTLTAADATRFASSYEGKGVHLIGNQLYLGKYSCLCGGNGNTDTTTGGTCVGATEGCDSQLHVWTLTSDRPTTSGYWYLAQDLTVTKAATVKSVDDPDVGINLDLNGYDVIIRTNNEGGRMYSTLNSGTNKVSILFTNTYRGTERDSFFIVDDSKHDDETTTPTGGDQGRIVWMKGSDKHVKVYNVDFDISEVAVRSDKTQGGIVISADPDATGNRSTLELYNVNMIGGNAKGSVLAVHKNTDALLHDAVISGHVGGADYSGVNVTDATSTLTLSGTTYVSGNKLSDGTTASNIRLVNGAKITLAEGYTGSVNPETNAVLHVTGITATLGEEDAPVDVVVGENASLTYAVKDLFETDDDKVLGLFDGKLQAYAAGTHIHCVCAGNLGTRANGYVYDVPGTTEDHTCADIIYTAISGELAGGSVKTGGNWYLSDDVTIKSGNHYQITGVSINLCLNGHNWNGADSKRALSLQSGSGYLSLTTCKADTLDADGIPTNNRVIAKGYNTQGFGVWVNSGTFDFYAGCIDGTNFKSSSHGAIVHVVANQTMNMYSSKCTILGGTNDANRNGAAVGSYGTTNMYNGTIKNGKSSNHGGNLHVSGSGVFTMYDGLITGGSTTNESNMITANVAMAGGTFNMLGGQIDGGFSQLGDADTNNATLVISGDAVIDGGTSGYNLRDTSRLAITLKDLKNTAKIVLDLTSSQTIAVEGTLPENWKTIVTAEGYTAELSADGKTITFTANTTP